MAVAFFVIPYQVLKPDDATNPNPGLYTRVMPAALHTAVAEWREAEFLGNRALVKVRATATVLTALAANGWFRFPLAALDNPLSSLSNGQRTAIRNQITDAGYPLAELNAAIPNLANATVGDVLRFILRRRLKPRVDLVGETVVCDGTEQPTAPIESIDVVSD